MLSQGVQHLREEGVFGERYSSDYDIFYSAKDYEGESRRIERLIIENVPGARTLLELGCGTGGHTKYLSRAFEMTSIDRSMPMLEIAKRKLNGSEVKFIQSDITKLPPFQEKFDVAMSLFHVLNYILTREELIGLFRRVNRLLNNTGIFIFDSWNGMAVITEKPEVRLKDVGTNHRRCIRYVIPKLDIRKNCCDNTYKVMILESGKIVDEYKETHRIRYLFPMEIDDMLDETGFRSIQMTNDWGEDLTEEDWSMQVVARKL